MHEYNRISEYVTLNPPAIEGFPHVLAKEVASDLAYKYQEDIGLVWEVTIFFHEYNEHYELNDSINELFGLFPAKTRFKTSSNFDTRRIEVFFWADSISPSALETLRREGKRIRGLGET